MKDDLFMYSILALIVSLLIAIVYLLVLKFKDRLSALHNLKKLKIRLDFATEENKIHVQKIVLLDNLYVSLTNRINEIIKELLLFQKLMFE